jgi:hypothetical protein
MMARSSFATCLFAALVLVLSSSRETEAAFKSINDFLLGQEFGGPNHAGPCPGVNGCELNFPEDLSESVRTSSVYVDIDQWVLVVIRIRVQEWMQIGDIVKGGYAKLTDVVCKNVQVPDIAVSHAPLPRGPSMDVDTAFHKPDIVPPESPVGIQVDKFKANVRTENLKLEW